MLREKTNEKESELIEDMLEVKHGGGQEGPSTFFIEIPLYVGITYRWFSSERKFCIL